jgi:hypothetical protein
MDMHFPHSAILQKSLAVLLLAAIIVLVLFPVFSYDLYWHLANGRYMVETGSIVNQEIFSYTAPGVEFHNHEWLSQIILYVLYVFGGGVGLLILKIGIVLAIVYFSYRTARIYGASTALALLLCLLAILAGLYRYTVRPQLFSLLGFSALIYILYGFRIGGVDKKALYTLPFIMIIWDWLHGAIYGLVFLIVFLLAEHSNYFLATHSRNKFNFAAMPKEDLQTLTKWMAITFVLMLLNPYGPLSYDVFVEMLNGNKMVSTTMEFLPANWEEHKPFWLLSSLVLLSILARGRKIELTQLIVLAPFFLLSVRYSRVIGVFALLTVPILAANIFFLSGRLAKHKNTAKKVGLGILSLVSLSTILYVIHYKFIAPETPQSFGVRMDDQFLPVGSVRFVKTLGLTGNLYNSGKFGGYLSFYLAPERKIFLYNHHAVFSRLKASVFDPGVIDKWNIEYAIVGSPRELRQLFPNRKWARIYRDESAVLVIRRSPKNQPIIDKYNARYFHPILTDEKIYQLARDARVYPNLIREMVNYLTFREDKRVTALLVALLEHQNNTMSESQKRELLQQVIRNQNAI